MKFKQFLSGTSLSALAAVSLLAAVPAIVRAQALPGITIFGGVEPQYRLNYRLDFGGNAEQYGERYRLRISRKKLDKAVSQFAISIRHGNTPTFDGEFDLKDVEVRVGGDNGEKYPVSEVTWNAEDSVLNIYMAADQPIPAGRDVTIMLGNVRNPSFGMYRFLCNVVAVGDASYQVQYIGTWEISID